jgi:hypothetical protein
MPEPPTTRLSAEERTALAELSGVAHELLNALLAEGHRHMI